MNYENLSQNAYLLYPIQYLSPTTKLLLNYGFINNISNHKHNRLESNTRINHQTQIIGRSRSWNSWEGGCFDAENSRCKVCQPHSSQGNLILKPDKTRSTSCTSTHWALLSIFCPSLPQSFPQASNSSRFLGSYWSGSPWSQFFEWGWGIFGVLFH